MLSRAARPAVRASTAPLARPAMAKQPSVATYATLREIESRLKSIRNIEKITKTMKIVASTKLTRAQRAMTESRTYGQTSQTVFDKAETKAADGEGQKTLLIVCSSDKGLCGGIHSGMSRFARRMLHDQPDMDIAIVGEKCKAQLSRSNPKQMVVSFAGIGRDIPGFAEAQAIADQVVLLPTDYTHVKVMYNKFNNASSFEPIVVEAYSEEAIKNSRTSQMQVMAKLTIAANLTNYEIDGDALANLREYALANSLFWALAEGHACEQASRRNAMDNASKNAGDMIQKFTILFNRTRQSVITTELVDIITGATASADV